MEIVIVIIFLVVITAVLLIAGYTNVFDKLITKDTITKKDIEKLDKVAGRYFVDAADLFEVRLKILLGEKLPELAYFSKERITLTYSKYNWNTRIDIDKAWEILREQWPDEDMLSNTRLKEELSKRITVTNYDTITDAIVDIMINYTFFKMFDFYNDLDEIKRINRHERAAFQVYVEQHPEAYQLARLRDKY